MRLLWKLTICLLWALASSSLVWAASDGKTNDTLTAVIEPLFALHMSPGMAVSVVHGEELIYAAGFGVADLDSGRPVETDTLFYIASTTKSFTAMAVALLAQRGELSLDTPISRYLPDLRLQEPLSADEITLRDLLTMTHGIASEGPVIFRTAYSGVHDPAQLVSLLASSAPAENGREFEYGNLGYNIASLVMDSALEVGWKEVLEREIFIPLGMRDTYGALADADRQRMAWPHVPTLDGFRRLPYTKAASNMHAAGGTVTSVLDLARWLEANLNGGRIDGKQVLPAEVVAAAHRQQVDQDRQFGSYHRHGWGLGWDLGTYDGDLLVHRFGSYAGFRSHVSFMPDHGVGVTVLVNDGRLGFVLADLVANAIYETVLEKPDLETRRAETLAKTEEMAAMGRDRLRQELEKRAARQVSLPHPLAAYAGVYENPEYGRFEWRQEGERLVAQIGLVHSDAEVYDAEENKLRVEITGRGEVVDFAFDGELASQLTYDGRVFRRVAQ